jgi:peptidyl-prolyl cis-trans isomerase B (cyclophilin B)
MAEARDRRLLIVVLFALLAVGIVAAILISRGGGSEGDDGETVAGASGCRKVRAPEPRQADLAAPEQSVKRGEKLTAVVETSCGTFEVALDTERAPKTVNSFVYLARQGFYDGLTFHRIAPGFVIQGGDPSGDGTGGPGYSVDEPPPPNLAYTKGVVAMAKTSAEPPGRSGSQFFIVTGADAGLHPDYALLGKVSRDSGLDVVERIGRLGTRAQTPKQTVVVEKVTIEKG